MAFSDALLYFFFTKSGNNLTVKSVELSKGIRPLLLDLQGIPRLVEIDSIDPGSVGHKEGLDERRLDKLIHHLEILGVFSQTRTAFRVERKNANAPDTVDNIPIAIVRGCAEEFDSELFRCYIRDWFALVERQREIITRNANPSLDTIAELIRRAEINVSLASANVQSLETVLNRVRQVSIDREKRFEVLKDIVEDVCLREMNLHVRLSPPEPTKVLELKPTSAVGFFGIPLQLAGEKLPIG